MAKSSRGAVPPIGHDAQEEMTVMVLRLKGGGDTLRKGFDALNNALAALGAPAPVVVQRHTAAALPPQVISAHAGTNGAGTVTEADPEEEEVEDEEQSSVASASAPAAPSKPRKKPPFNTKLDLNGKDKPWKDFWEERAPGTVGDSYLVATLWLTEQAGMTDFSLSDVFTLFRTAKWTEQADFSQPLRKLKSKESYFENPTPKTWKLTQHGLNAARAITKA